MEINLDKYATLRNAVESNAKHLLTEFDAFTETELAAVMSAGIFGILFACGQRFKGKFTHEQFMHAPVRSFVKMLSAYPDRDFVNFCIDKEMQREIEKTKKVKGETWA